MNNGKLRNMMNTPVFTVRNLLAFGLVASVFIVPFYIRMVINSELAYINALFYMSILVILVKYKGLPSIGGLALWVALALVYLITEVVAGTDTKDIVKFFFLYCAPILVCQLSFGKKASFRWRFVETVIRLVNVFTMVVFAVLVVDMITGSAPMRFLTTHYLHEMAGWVPSGVMERHPSIWGHYLMTAGFYLAFYYINVAYAKITELWLIDVRLLYLVASIGILSTGGKTALVIYLVSIIWLNLTDKHGLRNAVFLTIFLLALYWFGFFDIALERFGADDLSSGRNSATSSVFAVELPRFIGGYGEGFNAHMSALVTSYTVAIFSEYSLLALSYKFGVAFVVLMVALMLRGPFDASRRTRKWSLLFMAVMLIIYFSTFNAFAAAPDSYLVYVMFVLVVMQLSVKDENGEHHG